MDLVLCVQRRVPVATLNVLAQKIMAAASPPKPLFAESVSTSKTNHAIAIKLIPGSAQPTNSQVTSIVPTGVLSSWHTRAFVSTCA